MPGDRPSRTAIKVARGVVYFGCDPEIAPLLPPGATESSQRLLLSVGQLKPWHLKLFRALWFQRFYAFVERRTMPGMMRYLALRKRFMEEETRAAIAGGATQVLNLGAGFDTLCVRLAAELPDVAFFEIDHPPTAALKRVAVEKTRAQRPNLHLVAADLATTRLRDALDARWRRDVRSALVAEGLLMYLPPAGVGELLAEVRRVTAPGSRLALSYVHPDDKGRVHLGKMGWLSRFGLRLSGEPMLWAVRAGEIAAFLRKRGYRFEPRDLPHDADVESVGVAETLPD